MKHRLAICLFLVALMVPAIIPDFCGAVDLEAKITVLREQIERQIELIKEAREKADTSVSLAAIRVSEQLIKSEEELAAQVEMLDQLREQLRDQIDAAREATAGLNQDWGQMLSQAAAQIDAQIKQTNSVIDRMRQIRESVGDDPETGTCPKTTPSSGTSLTPILPVSPQTTEPTPQTDPVATAPQPDTKVGPVADQPTVPQPASG
jgi:hypothetical protein